MARQPGPIQLSAFHPGDPGIMPFVKQLQAQARHRCLVEPLLVAAPDEQFAPTW